MDKHMSWKTEDRQDNENKSDWQQVWASCKAPAVTLKIIQTSNGWLMSQYMWCSFLLSHSTCVFVYLRVVLSGRGRLGQVECCSIEAWWGAAPAPHHFFLPTFHPSIRLPVYLLSFSALLLFISLPLKPQSDLPPVFFYFFYLLL